MNKKAVIGGIAAAVILVGIIVSIIMQPKSSSVSVDNSNHPTGEPQQVSGLVFDVTSVSVSDSWPAAGLYAQSNSDKYMLVELRITNVGTEEKPEPIPTDFRLLDSSGKTYPAGSYGHLQTTDIITGGINANSSVGRALFFQLHYDPSLSYKLYIKDRLVELQNIKVV